MVIDFNATDLPKGSIGWTALLTAVENAHPNDENEWIEFKANLDPTTVDGRYTVAKAIVAFANRDPDVAAKWLGGHAVIIIGLEPGNLAAAPEIDPANLYNSINQLLAPPAPAWDPTPILYRGEHVLAISVDPPRSGDPIACIGRSSGRAVDGHIYVRKQGKSEMATSADLRRLSNRLLSGTKTISGLSIQPIDGDAIAVIEYQETWLDEWLNKEEHRLLEPLTTTSPSRETSSSDLTAAGVSAKRFAEYTSQAQKTADLMAAALGTVTHPERRTEEEYRAEIAEYLANCRDRLREGFDDLLSTAANDVTFVIHNATDQNYEQALVHLHVEGDVYGYEYDAEFASLADYLPEAPRIWGPRTESRLLSGLQARDYTSILPTYTYPGITGAARGPSPTISNDGSVSITCVPLHIYPHSSSELITLRLVAKAPVASPITVRWTATAANVNGRTNGVFTIPSATTPVDLAELMELDEPDVEKST